MAESPASIPLHHIMTEINGAKVADFRGDPPPRGGPPGVYAESGGNAVTWLFPRVQLF